MKIIIGADHAGFTYKQQLIQFLKEQEHTIEDVGAHERVQEDDYPDYAEKVATAFLDKKGDRGILICGSAVGVSVAANKFPGIRAGVCHDTYSAHQCVEHDNANILCMGARVIGSALAKDIVQVFLTARFSGAPRHRRRLEKLEIIEAKTMKEVTK